MFGTGCFNNKTLTFLPPFTTLLHFFLSRLTFELSPGTRTRTRTRQENSGQSESRDKLSNCSNDTTGNSLRLFKVTSALAGSHFTSPLTPSCIRLHQK